LTVIRKEIDKSQSLVQKRAANKEEEVGLMYKEAGYGTTTGGIQVR